MKSSHGLLTNFLTSNLLKNLSKQTNNFLDSKNYISNYYSNMLEFIPDYKLILNSEIISKVRNLIYTTKPLLSAVELHVQLPECDAIPPHQDNFYHCISPPEYGVKILIPLSKLNSQNGGLSFLDVPINYPVLDHIPSKSLNFSSILAEKDFKRIKKDIISYEYNIGDISYHYLNSIHFSNGNKTTKTSTFLVFRFENPESIKDKDAITKYSTCLEKHKKIIEKSKLFQKK